MASYYYLAATLPSLIFGQHPPMSPESFRDTARTVLDEQDALLLDELDLDPGKKAETQAMENAPAYSEAPVSSGSEFIDSWREWERTLRLNLAKNRAQKTKREGISLTEPPLYPADAVQASIRASALTESPLEAEIVLDKARWDAIDTIQGIDYFDRNTIFAFYLRLKLLERRAFFDNEIGFAEYKSLYTSILESVEPGVLP